MDKAEQILDKHINEDDLNFIFHEKKQLWQELLNAVNEALRQHDVSGSLGFDKGYEQGYNDATREACQEIAKNYQPNDR